MTILSPSINGKQIPLSWHLSPKHVRHLCGSAETVKLAAPDAPAPVRFKSEMTLAAEAFGGLAAEPLKASLRPLVESALQVEQRSQLLGAVLEISHGRIFGATELEVSRRIGLSVDRARKLLKEEEAAGRVVRRPGAPGRPDLWRLSEEAWVEAFGKGEPRVATGEDDDPVFPGDDTKPSTPAEEDEEDEDACACCSEEVGIGASPGGVLCHACHDAGCLPAEPCRAEGGS